MRRASILSVVALTIACGDSPTAPSAGTRVEAVIQDSPGSTATVTGTLAGTVGIGGSDQRAELSVPVSTFTVQADTGIRHTIVFELRSQQWLTSAAVQSGRVEDAALQAAITATTRAQNR